MLNVTTRLEYQLEYFGVDLSRYNDRSPSMHAVLVREVNSDIGNSNFCLDMLKRHRGFEMRDP